MRRRHVLAAFSLLATLPRALAQSGRMPAVGFLGLATPAGDAPTLAAFRDGLRMAGLDPGRNLRLEARHAHGDATQLQTLIAELAGIPVDVFLAPGQAVARPLMRATRIPIVAIGLPPVDSDPDLFESLARPGRTLTGFSSFGEELNGKRIEILREAMPDVRVVGVIHNATDRVFNRWGERTEAEIRARGLTPVRVGLTSTASSELAAHFTALHAAGGQALIVIRDFLTTSLRERICEFAAGHGIAVIAEQREFAEAGALFSYGADIPELFRTAAAYVARIIAGENPGDLPIQLPSKLEMVLNLQTARTLRLAPPPDLLARADDVIE